MVTFSAKLPAAICIVSPGSASLTAAWMVVWGQVRQTWIVLAVAVWHSARAVMAIRLFQMFIGYSLSVVDCPRAFRFAFMIERITTTPAQQTLHQLGNQRHGGGESIRSRDRGGCNQPPGATNRDPWRQGHLRHRSGNLAPVML